MFRIILFAFILVLTVGSAAAQKKRQPAVKTPVKTAPSTVLPVSEIAATDWKTLTETLKAENWTKTAQLCAGHLEKLSADNEKKQLAQLRYIYLFALAGNILQLNADRKPAEAEKAWLEFDRVFNSFIGKEFVIPARPFSADCRQKFNYVCPVKNEPKALRITATNNEGNAIHAFNYVVFDNPIAFPTVEDTEVLVSGILKNAEYNDDASKPWAVRLYFKQGKLF